MSNDRQDVLLRAQLEQVYRQHRQALFSVALMITGCAGLAEDAVHEAFVRLCQRADRPAGSLVAYVFSSVRNAAVDCRRRQQRQRALAESVFAEVRQEGTSSGESSDSSERKSQLLALVEALEEPVRQIVVMKIFGELTFDEIGEVLETPAATVATRYRRAIMKLEESLRKRQ
jgi:RNA polymerase sigma-70 factor (ECF subfamily)